MANVTITPSNVVPGTGTTTQFYNANLKTGEAIDAGEIVCVMTDGLAYKADCNNPDRLNVIGMAGNSADASGQRISVITASPQTTIGSHSVANGLPLFLSATPGKICPLADVTSTGYNIILVAFVYDPSKIQIVLAKSTQAYVAP